jgi:hypothetical protein
MLLVDGDQSCLGGLQVVRFGQPRRVIEIDLCIDCAYKYEGFHWSSIWPKLLKITNLNINVFLGICEYSVFSRKNVRIRRPHLSMRPIQKLLP